jgi:type II secretory pathway pseudopilin PulG
MNANKQLINLAGILIVVVLLVAGVALIAMPLFTQSRSIDSQTRDIAQNNLLLEQQIASLTEAGGRVDEIDADLAELRAEIAPHPQLDDAYWLVSEAAKTADVHIQTVEAQPATAWSPRGAGSEDGGAAPTEPAAPEGSDGVSEDAAEAETPAPADGAAEGEALTAEGEEPSVPNRQVLLTVTLDVTTPYAETPDDSSADEESGSASAGESADDGGDVELPGTAELARFARKTATFVDALGVGPRLMSPIDVKYSFDDGEAVITVLTYFRTEGS